MKHINKFLLMPLIAAFMSAAFAAEKKPFEIPEIKESNLTMEQVVKPVPKQPRRKWTFIVYSNGQDDMASAVQGQISKLQQLKTTDDVAIAAEIGLNKTSLFNGQWEGTTRFYLNSEGKPIVAGKQKTDLGDYKNIQSFIKWAKTNFPADNYLLFLSGHGLGYLDPKRKSKGMMFDSQTNNYVQTRQLGQILKDVGGVDVLVMESCLMQMMEVLFEIKQNAKYVVGSQALLYTVAFDISYVGKTLINNPSIEQEALCRSIVGNARANIDRHKKTFFGRNLYLTVSAVDTAKFPAVIESLNNWTTALVSQPNAFGLIKPHLETLPAMPNSKEGDYPFVDLKELVNLVTERGENDEALNRTGGALIKSIDSAVISKAVLGGGKDNSKFNNFGGISIGFFAVDDYSSEYENYLEYPFAKRTSWGKFIQWLNQEYSNDYKREFKRRHEQALKEREERKAAQQAAN